MKSDRWKLAWLVLAVVYGMFGLVYSVIQPLTALPDETAHVQYVDFLANQHRLPIWSALGGGEAGYEAQHPAFAPLLYAIPYALAGGLPEAFRWYAVRWFAVLLGFALLPIMAQLGRRLFPAWPLAQLALAATVQLMPLTLLYLCHANPDGIALILCAAALLLAARIHGDPSEAPWLPWAAGGVAALAALTKLSVAPVGLILLAAQWLRPGQSRQDRLRSCGIVAGVWLVAGGWWYARNAALYGTPFIHTAGKLGTGLDLAARSNVLDTVWFTLSETYLSTWAQRGWFPAGLDLVLYALITAMVLAAIAGFVLHRKPAPHADAPDATFRFITWASLAMVVMVLAGQQSAFWTVDVELNAGGRYMLAALPAIAVLLVAGVGRLEGGWRRYLPGAWITLLVVMNVVAIYTLRYDLVPRNTPNWRMFQFPGDPPHFG